MDYNDIISTIENKSRLLEPQDVFIASFDSRRFSCISDITVVRDDSYSKDLEDSDMSGSSNGSGWRNFSRRQILLFCLFSASNFFAAVTFSLMAPFYPAEAESKGANASEYGMVFGIFELVSFLTSPIIGKYLYFLGPKKTFIVGILITGIATACFGFLQDLNTKTAFLTLSFIVRIVAAVGDAALVTANFSLVAAEFPKYVATTFATLETFFGLGLIVGPTLGGLLYELGGFRLPFFLVGGLTTVLGVIAIILMPIQKETDYDDDPAPSLLKLIKITSVSLAGLSILACALSMGYLSATLEPHVRQFGLTPLTTGFIFIIHGGIYALTAPAWGWLCDNKISPTKLTLMGEVTIFIGFIFIGPVAFLPIDTYLWLTCVGLAIYGMGLGAGMVSSFIMALEQAVEHGMSDNIQTYGVISALWNSAFALGSFLGPSVGGVLLDEVGFRWGTVFVLGVQVIVVILFLCYLAQTGNAKKTRNNYSKNLSDPTTPLLAGLLDDDNKPSCSKMLDGGDAEESFGYGTNNNNNMPITHTFYDSSS